MIELHLDPQAKRPLSHQLVERLRTAIYARRIPAGEQLPSVRELARQTGVNPLTIGKAYAELERERLIETRWGKGSFVREVDPAAGRGAAKQLDALVDAFVADALPLARSAEAVVAAVRRRLEAAGGA